MDWLKDIITYRNISFGVELIGYLVIAHVFLFIIVRAGIYIYHRLSTHGFKWHGGPHTWAVVTGSTDGIGLAYAKQLAEKGYNLLLISRNEQKLLKVSEDILQMYGHKRVVRTLAVDFSEANDETFDTIEREFNSIDEIHVLVNNVGICYPKERPEYLTKIPNLVPFVKHLINVNIMTGTRLTALLLPRMERRGRGVIINLSSFTAITPTPLLALYSASKVYIDFMSRALQEEYRAKGIVIQSVLPYYVSTHMAYNMKPKFYCPTPDRFVRQALRTVGREDRTAGFFVHEVWNDYVFWSNVWSRLMGIDWTIRATFSRLRAVRSRILAKERRAEQGEEAVLTVNEERDVQIV